MIEGVLRHCTEMAVKKNYVDSHGQCEVAFAFCSPLRFELLPRLKNLPRQKLYRCEAGEPEDYANLQLILTRPIDLDLIRKQYDEIVKYATALRGAIGQEIHRYAATAHRKDPLHRPARGAGSVRRSCRSRTTGGSERGDSLITAVLP